MSLSRARAGLPVALIAAAGFALLVTGCNKGTPTAASPPTTTTSTPSTTSSPPAMTPSPAEIAASAQAGTGPAAGATSVGGMHGGPQDSGGAKMGSMPAPTGGDSAASSPATAASANR